MKDIKKIKELREILKPLKHKHTIAFVPTMGNLHEGHLALVHKAKEIADITVVSIFVNPLQFAPSEDFSNYPRTLQEDIKKLSKLNVDLVFSPSAIDLYPNLEEHTKVSVPILSDEYCGRFRPSLFDGVTTIVATLFNIVQPDSAVFGEKDFQQLHILKKMVEDLAFPIQIISVPTVREQDGLAMSSRNQYLNADERNVACEIYKILHAMQDDLLQGRPQAETIMDATSHLQKKNFSVDYISICDKKTLVLANTDHKEIVILIAAWLGKTRLIDNLSFSLL
jgi:pantoate--beta-alanine ligase